MGQLYQFECSNCGYRAEVSGGDDRGIAAATTTIACRACRRLYDVPTAQMGDSPSKPIPPSCPDADHHPIEQWTAGGPCPRCGTPISPGEGAVILWD